MEQKFPNSWGDPKSGRIARFESPRERLIGGFLPGLGNVVLQGLRLAAATVFFGAPAALVMGSFALAARAVAGALGRARDIAMFRGQLGAEDGKGDFPAYDLSNPAERDRLSWRIGRKHEGFAADYLRLSADAGLEKPPRLLLMDMQMSEKTGWKSRAPRRYYGVGSTRSPARTGGSVIMLGEGALKSLQPAQLRARVAQEFARLKLQHGRAQRRTGLRRIFGAALSGAIIYGASASEEVTVDTALHLAAATAFVGLPLEGIRRRRERAAAERGGLILAGDATSAIEAMVTLRVKSGTMVKSDFGLFSLRHLGLIPETDGKGYAALRAFEKANPDFLAARRARFDGTIPVPPPRRRDSNPPVSGAYVPVPASK